MKKVKVNFEYREKLIPLMVDDSLIQIHNILNLSCELHEELSKHEPKKADKVFDKDDIWDNAYDYLEAKCQEVFKEAYPDADAYVFGFKITNEKEDVTSLRVAIAEY